MDERGCGDPWRQWCQDVARLRGGCRERILYSVVREYASLATIRELCIQPSWLKQESGCGLVLTEEEAHEVGTIWLVNTRVDYRAASVSDVDPRPGARIADGHA